ncbi:MAG: hypothetical protein EA380_01725 [Phycisphaeraceae bacterium]|nr:MAG: hypothetical protein EA380_01725 [Phycisphaeraceae bacterium]
MMSTRTNAPWLAVGVALLGAPALHASFVDLDGDLGNNTWNGGVVVSPINTATTTPFTHVSANGDITGDVIATNTGGANFELTITNVVFNALNTAGVTIINLLVRHSYEIDPTTFPGPYLAEHMIDGTWSTAPSNSVDLESFHGTGVLTISPPPLSLTNSLMTTSFNLGPTSASVPLTTNIYTIQMNLRLAIDGAGTITLPNSADSFATYIPTPATAALLALGGLASTRRRR